MLEVSLVVQCRDSISEPFHTDTGAPQRDCASANSFIYYLIKSLEVQTPDSIVHDHHYHHQSITSHEILDELTKYNYAQPTQIQHFNIEMEYVDELTSDHNDIRRDEHNVKENLGKKGLKLNKNKTLKITSSADKSSVKKVQASRDTSQHRGKYQKKKYSCDKCCQHSTLLLSGRQIDNQLKTETDRHVHRTNFSI